MGFLNVSIRLLVKFQPLNQNSMSKSSVQVCLLSSVSTAMQKERPAEFVLVPAVKVQWGERRGQEEPSCLVEHEGVDAVMLFLKILSQLLKGMP